MEVLKYVREIVQGISVSANLDNSLNSEGFLKQYFKVFGGTKSNF